MLRRRTLQAIALSALTAIAPAMAQTSPKPITMLVPFAAGGNIDIVARIIAPALSKQLGQTIVVQNRPGGGGSVAAAEVARAQPDGSTLLITTPNPLVIVPKMVSTTYTINSFESIGLISSTSLVFTTRAGNPKFKDMASFLAYARANPGKVSIGNAGIGTTNHIAIMQLQSIAKLDLNVVTYKGSGPAIIDLLGGQIDAMVDQLSSSVAHIKGGRMTAISVLAPERDPLLPETPSTKEVGLPTLDISTTLGLLAPAKTPEATVKQLGDALFKVLQDSAVKEQLLNVASIARPGPTNAFSVLLKREDKIAAELATAGKLKVE
ncbi:tripartite tricarboxylate transporter substrate binding protein [Alcaligenaceae bacterium LF4-65]|jgi:tripartite-type tricarboxylate transporter receptor subunit TctC|uniref:Tripartite tricarboxylate transporter substrate binding protein n=1 Tax=Zwartia hollandica TaxID=324606 RepID=A0A953T3Z1_9BURK|nr:tripartite tricarboxylate transporter substrate binding protein [Zwartia hollandica]MBZ1349926.1 tripartite tricarboxylate transporter substrate binding protein [Zwartia hollandica]